MSRKRLNNLIMTYVATRMVYLVLIFSLYLFFAGHNAPGGGFIAGLMTAAAIVLVYVTFGSNFLQSQLYYDFRILMGIGLLFSFGCGMGGVLFGLPFLTHTFFAGSLPLLGHIELATATIFDFGVYLVVVGGTVTIITSIGEN
ncbi:MAG: Na(+)/H(+) antiporter subunit B [Clostridia bacterium]|nr:Na(+)/H(+) antiporter subunit B [Clostridia bacterium]MDD4798161.1 Na(+)/H(+) antiporter subunit B [Clostridia bacterium]